jgi:hypothetical protein
MNKLIFLMVLTAVALGLPQTTTAQVPYIQIYFDEDLQRTAEISCPLVAPGSRVGTIYIAAHNFSMLMRSIEYGVDYPPELLFTGDGIDSSYQVVGDSRIGIVISFPTPLDAFETVVLQKAEFVWMCSACESTAIPVVVVPHPSSGKIRAISWPDSEEVEGVGMTAIVCPTIPVENSTWGHIKALYK